jgi:hypothetical protein
VAHVVSHRALSVQKSKHWCTFPIGDAQSSPHFMRYSGLTGAAINSMMINNYIGAGLDSSAVFTQDRAMQLSKETNWTNEEVVKRGTGGNFGDDGFLRPGFKYVDVAEYLYYKAVELGVYSYQEELVENQIASKAETSCDPIDSKVGVMFQNAMLKKFASALVPRGMELMSSYIDAVETSLSKAILDKILNEMQRDKDLTNEAATLAQFQTFANKKTDMTKIKGDGTLMSRTKSRWNDNIEELFQESPPSGQVQDKIREYMARANIMVDIIRKSYLVARDDHINGTRISSEAENEPKSVDYLVVDLAVEAKSFANGLARSALLATISLALNTTSSTMALAAYWTALVGFANVFVAFGTMTNVSRYQNRNEEFRTEFLKKKMPRVERAIFMTLSPSARDRVISNPFNRQFELCFQEFQASAKYYDASCDEIQSLYKELDLDSIKSMEIFMQKIRSHFIPIVYHKDAYLKDSLLKVHNAAGEIVDLLLTKPCNGEADDLFVTILDKLPLFSMQLQNSLQTGPIKYGFRREGKTLNQCVLFAPFRYFYFRICNIFLSDSSHIDWRPVSSVTKDLFQTVEKCNVYLGGNRLKCEARDLKELFSATMESTHASAVYFVACLSFTFALLFTAITMITAIVMSTMSEETVNEAALPTWLNISRRTIQEGSAFASIFAACSAVEFFSKLLYHQRKIIKTARELPNGISVTVGKVVYIATVQSFVSLTNSIAAIGSIVALICGVLYRLDENVSPFDDDEIWWVALGSILSWLIASFASLYTDFFLLWNLDPKASRAICVHFKSMIVDIYKDYGEANNDDSIIRDYTTREFLSITRFDSSLGADRFSAIMQTILSKEFDLNSTGRSVISTVA